MRPTVTRVRWDRLGRMAMLCVLAALLYLYLTAGVSLVSTWKEARGDSAQLTALERQHASLEAQHAALASPITVMREARRLGMVRPGEQTYVITGLPSN
jgi:cell division protein FtsB